MKEFDRITQNPAVMGGKPCIRGMRVTVGMIVGQVGLGRQSIPSRRIPLILSAKTSCKRSVMRLGGLKSVRSCSRTHEAASRYDLRPGGSFLAQFGVEAIHWSSIGQAKAPDTDIAAYAKSSD